MSNKTKGVVVSDKQGLLFAVPADVLKQYVVAKEDFASASAFFKGEEDDVSGQSMQMDWPWEEGGFGEEILINHYTVKFKFDR